MNDTNNYDQVGIVGMGTMGKEILKRMVAAGKQIYAYDPFPSALVKIFE